MKKILCSLVFALVPALAFAGNRSLCEANPDAPMCRSYPAAPYPQNPALWEKANASIANVLSRNHDRVISNSCRWVSGGYALSCRFTTARKHDCAIFVQSSAEISCRR